MAKTPAEIEAAMLANLPATTGKSLEQWMAALADSPAAKHGEIVRWLKEQGVTHGYANLIAHQHLASSAGQIEEQALLAAHYAGPKQELLPIYELLCARLRAMGPDVEFAPKKGYVSVRRGKQFALIQPSTKTRLDVGIQLKGAPASTRLETSGSFNAMVSHRVRLSSLQDVDVELLDWLRQAYERA